MVVSTANMLLCAILLISGVGGSQQQLDLGPADDNLDGKLSHRELARVIRLAQQRAHDAARGAALPAATAVIGPIFDAGRPDAAVDFVYPDFVFGSARSTVGGDRPPEAGDGGALRRRMDDHMWAFADVAPADGRLSRAEFLAYMRPALAVDAAAYERLQAERRLLSMAYLDGTSGGTLTWQEFEQGSAFGDGEGVGGGSDGRHAGRLREAFDRCGRGEGLERGLQSDVTVACFAALTDNQSAASQAAELLAAADADGDLLLAPGERVLSDDVRQRLQALLDAHRDAEAAMGQHGELR